MQRLAAASVALRLEFGGYQAHQGAHLVDQFASFGDVGKYAADCQLLLGASWGGPTQMIAL
jgi:hypothetical protein